VHFYTGAGDDQPAHRPVEDGPRTDTEWGYAMAISLEATQKPEPEKSPERK